MTYQEQSDNLYRNPMQRNRMEMCVRQQGLNTYSDDPLGQGVIGGDAQDIDALIAAISVSPNWATVAESDPDLLAATQSVWASVSAARYPQPAAMGK
jgi:hypothetical protein